MVYDQDVFWSRRAFHRGLVALTATGSAASAACTQPPTVRTGPRKRASMQSSPSTSTDRTAGPTDGRMPVVFVGHGSPMNAIEDNAWSRGFAALGQTLPRPRAILCVSAHWFVDGILLTENAQPRTIHDFGGFPRALYEIEYPARGAVDLARRVRDLLDEHDAKLSSDWGLDHGTWSVLRHMYPEADVPVIQLSLDRRLDPRRHFELGRSLAPLRDDGVLIVGSGNIVHNLRDAITRRSQGREDTPEWAASFDAEVVARLEQRDHAGLASLWPGADTARMAHPSPDHWLPLLYVAAASLDGDELRFPTEGFDLGSVSMRSASFG